jgi:peptide/nickel transport system permease protein
MFGGTMLTEVIFSYPGVGTLAYAAVVSGDLNTLMCIVFFSIIFVATAVFVLDLLMPLLDPRIRYR